MRLGGNRQRYISTHGGGKKRAARNCQFQISVLSVQLLFSVSELSAGAAETFAALIPPSTLFSHGRDMTGSRYTSQVCYKCQATLRMAGLMFAAKCRQVGVRESKLIHFQHLF